MIYLMSKIFGATKNLSKAKLYGSHYHSLSVHIPFIFRIFAISSLVPETEESLFHTLRVITQHTSSKHPGDID